jgi:hypothetical protein
VVKNDRYILNSAGNPVPEPDLIKWAMWFEDHAKRRVAADEIEGIRVSTIFLALDHRWMDDGPPILWETMVFGGKLDQELDRCAGSREQAEAMHAAMCARVRATRKPKTGRKRSARPI